MAEELGKIEKPEVESYKGERNLYLVPLLFSTPDMQGCVPPSSASSTILPPTITIPVVELNG